MDAGDGRVAGGGWWGRAEGVVSLVPMLAMAWQGLWHYIGTNAGTREHSNWFLGTLHGRTRWYLCAEQARDVADLLVRPWLELNCV